MERDLLQAANRVQNQATNIDLSNTAGRLVNNNINIVKNFIDAPIEDPKGLISTLKEIEATTKGVLLEDLLQPVSFAPSLISLEQKYLVKVRKLLGQMVGVVEPKDEDDPIRDTNNEGLIASNFRKAQEAKERRQQAAKEKLGSTKMYTTLRKMHKVLSQQTGSFIIFLIKELSKLIAKFTRFVNIQIDKIVSFIKKEVKGRVDKEKKQYEDRLQAILKKKLQNDLIPQSITYNIASLLFWTGAVWTNTTGATFQVITIPPFKKLRIDGRLEGTAPSVRELARNFELQLTQMQGLCIPNPATGIPPFPFVGYK